MPLAMYQSSGCSSETVEKLRGPVGSKVVVKVQRGQQEPFDSPSFATSSRSICPFEDADGIGYVRSPPSQNGPPGLMDAVDDCREEGDALKGIVLDLRNNPAVC